MKKRLFYAALVATSALLTGCSTTAPEAPAPAIQAAAESPLPVEMANLAASVQESGGLAAVGSAESKDLYLAMNRAKVNGRIELARILNDRVEALAKAYSEETGIAYESLFLSGFNRATKAVSAQIAVSVAQTLKFEQAGSTYTAYALLALDPQAIADQLAKEADLYGRLKTTKAFDELNQEIKTYAAFKAAQP